VAGVQVYRKIRIKDNEGFVNQNKKSALPESVPPPSPGWINSFPPFSTDTGNSEG